MAVLGSLSNEVLTSTMCLVNQTRNSRPLTAASNNPEDLEAPTPTLFV